MRRMYITFSGRAYDITTARIVQDAPHYGAHEVRVYDDKWLMTTEFYAHNKWLWDTPNMRGFGWFCWKPFVIMHALAHCDVGDVVLYTDADTYPIADLSPIYERAEAEGAMFFAAEGISNRGWVKRDCWIVMGEPFPECDKRDTQHTVARFIAVKKGPWRPLQLLMEWLTYAVNPLATTFAPSVIEQCEFCDLHEHRTEQAILSLLTLKYGYPLYREACQYGNQFLESKDTWYPQLFIQDGVRQHGEPWQGSSYANVG